MDKPKADTQGHLIVSPNLFVSGGRHYCLACRRAKWFFKGLITPEFYTVADRYYREIMGRVPDQTTPSG